MDREIRQKERLSQVLGYIENNLHSDINVESLADVSHWSRWQLQRVFSANTGLSVAQYVRQLRLSQSAMQLISGDQRHLDIALSNGFGSEVSFNRAFRQHFGCTPREYRKRGIPNGIRFSLKNEPMRSIRLEQRPAFSLLGIYSDIYGVFSPHANFKEKVPKLWQDTINVMSQEKIDYQRLIAVIDVALFGESKLRYWCGCEVTADMKYPQPLSENSALSELNIPEQMYAVITHLGDIWKLSETITWFIKHWLDQSPYEAFEGFDIEELITPQSTPLSNNKQGIDYWVPIRPVQV